MRPEMALEAGVITGSSARAQSRVHNPCYHELHKLSNIIIVLIFSEKTSFVRMILQREENKGVELTVYPCNGLRALDCEGPMRGEGRGFFSTLASRETKMRFAAEAAGQIE